jgi:hypothetical protein
MTMQEWFRDKSQCPWVAQPEPGLEHLWRNLKIIVQRCSPSNLTELDRICRKEWVCQVCSVLPKKTRGGNRCLGCFNKSTE